MIYIYQVLGNPDSYRPTKFVVDPDHDEYGIDRKTPSETLLSSIFVFKNIKYKENIKIILLRPMSLNAGVKEIKLKLDGYLTFDKDYEIVDIPAYGIYNGKNYDYTPDEILLAIFIDMIKRINIDDKLFIDINTGVNEYVTLLIEATAYLIVTLSLKNIRDEKILDTYQIISEPIAGNQKEEMSIFIQKMRRKIFFSLPYDNKNGEITISRFIDADKDDKKGFFESDPSDKEYYGKYRRIINNLTVIFNSIRFNALPFISNFNDIINDIEYESLSEVEEQILNKFSSILHYRDNRKIKVKDVHNLINFIMALKFYQGLINLLKDKLEDLKDLDKLYNIGEEIYKNQFIDLPANYEFLKRDLDNYEIIYKTIKKNIKNQIKKQVVKKGISLHIRVWILIPVNYLVEQ